MPRNVLKSSVQNASFSIIFQVLFRCITFILNAFIIRTVGHDVLGIMNVRLLLLESTILFLSKEPIIKACLTDTKSHNWAQVINQIWISVPLTALLSLALVYVWIYLLSPIEPLYMSQYELGCYAIAISCIVEQMTQSVVLVAQAFCFVKLKIGFETLYIVFRTIVFVCCVLAAPQNALNAFSIAQLTSALFLAVLYYGFFHWYIRTLKGKRQELEKKHDSSDLGLFKEMHDFPFESVVQFLPLTMPNQRGLVDRKLCVLSISFAKQSVVKQILTEGERYVMTLSPVLTFAQQSIYDIVNNLGSLAARFIFRPIEESAYFYFTQVIQRDLAIDKQDYKLMEESAQALNQLCNVVTTIGLVVLTFGQTYSRTMLFLYGGDSLANALPVTLLRWHCFAIVFLAVNGVTEAFVFATMNNKQLDRYNYVMVLLSVSFLLVSYLFTYFLGPVGFIMANCLNMLARITHSLLFIAKKYQGTLYNPLRGLIPNWKFVTVLVVSFCITKTSEVKISTSSLLLHIVIGGICFTISALTWCWENQSLLKLGYDRYKRKVSLKEE